MRHDGAPMTFMQRFDLQAGLLYDIDFVLPYILSMYDTQELKETRRRWEFYTALIVILSADIVSRITASVSASVLYQFFEFVFISDLTNMNNLYKIKHCSNTKLVQITLQCQWWCRRSRSSIRRPFIRLFYHCICPLGISYFVKDNLSNLHVTP
jgi:hypothetical protein